MCPFLLCTFLNITNEYMNILLFSPRSVRENSFSNYEYSLFDCIFWFPRAEAIFYREIVPLLYIRILLNIADRPAVSPRPGTPMSRPIRCGFD